jgi:hypothetical protein
MENQSSHPRSELDQLMAEVGSYAERELRNQGRLATALIIASLEGPLVMKAGNMETEAAKDEFAAIARLFCVAHGASMAVLVFEAWIVAAKEGQPLDLSVRPSQSPERQECLVICGESMGGMAKQTVLPMLRTETSEFNGFGDALPLPPSPPEGRFARLLPMRAPRKGERKLAQSLLKSRGVTRAGSPVLN